ncbi:tRNA adenosine(34) deaminase TadA [Tissierella creatinophila]|uniref:tRNA-specific adenosine deaminase n=1 Tax=Tissierella creatinophila DSM 6911 TaxID=1123403 RepID=A0A1U7M801_TISCR|nr:tRNA adenosine(34) deaminase TadA [Tissierella creatinophila]OLS03442.1 tRNA-specific adenosine deaminase [Tissierella creatinophila DSM 6911]
MDEHFMKEALKEAKYAYELLEVPVGAIIVYDGKIIGRGHNKVETLKNSLSHAEIIAIDEASKSMDAWRLIDSTMYVTLEPCAMCAGAIVNSRIKRLVIGSLDPKRGCAGSLINIVNHPSLNHRVEVETGILEKECTEILQNFFKELRKIKEINHSKSLDK